MEPQEIPVAESQVFGPASRDEELIPSPFEEINARRAQVENTELLQHLRGL